MSHPNAAKEYIVALDQGTTSSRAIIFNRQAQIVGVAQRELTQHYPQTGWVEQDPMEIWSSQSSVLVEVLAKTGIDPDQIASIGITNQRETTIVWDSHTGRPIYNAIVWQCRRTAPICEELKAQGLSDYIQENTGLVIDAYFSATKIKWILDHVDGAREKAEQGQLLFGTVDSWLIWNFTQGHAHVTDYTNASRTMLFNLKALDWDDKLLEALSIPRRMLPQVCSSSKVYGQTRMAGRSNARIPLAGIAGDQQAALFGQFCFEKGMAKNTYGTGCFLLMNTGQHLYHSAHGLISTLAINAEGQPCYALEGSVFMGGATIQWLRDELGIVHDASDTDYFASKIPDSGGVYLVPAFVGMGAPYWDPDARGMIVGLTRGTNRNHIIRATLEAIAYQSRDVLEAIQQDSGLQISSLKVDGGAAANDFLMQFQSDIMGVRVDRPQLIETTALGAAMLAGLSVDFWESTAQIQALCTVDKKFTPEMSRKQRQQLYGGWANAVKRALSKG
ncbi:glycerol kinase GlpK [Celerinatantimonas sp. YJH-8]|uniref:glycerol kinase GlpK n=1 Tax=Celerinatantimonas sp. YJH-8 TaxID=3228714 RepID=UPI0038C91918